MSLRQLAEADLGTILEDGTTGFGWPIVVTDPNGNSKTVNGFTDDISQLIDPETGQIVSGRLASVALRLSSLIDAGLSLPQGIGDSNSKPWVVEFDDVNGNSHKFKVSQSNPDRSLGVITLILEFYE